ncbi:hypothetical protein [Corynebacterium renale]|uniref:Uncharacterized protein n=1 Tax=Corynebacterium renale TaxID=1724 RepID=A0A2A9DL52_9CORY|nr:hypothetical protein [Corynebacterium renale]PFG27418.1 hypothetical protein ATK06_0476 [Corynebacterium renale]SQI23423.1 Uncharacterised protein [Corynebacterium renale]
MKPTDMPGAPHPVSKPQEQENRSQPPASRVTLYTTRSGEPVGLLVDRKRINLPHGTQFRLRSQNVGQVRLELSLAVSNIRMIPDGTRVAKQHNKAVR